MIHTASALVAVLQAHGSNHAAVVVVMDSPMEQAKNTSSASSMLTVIA